MLRIDSREKSQDTLAGIQVGDDAGSDHSGSNGGGRKWLDYGYTFDARGQKDFLTGGMRSERENQESRVPSKF